MKADFIDLYGTDAAQGMQVHPGRFWSAFSGPVGAEAEAYRARLLAAYSTTPPSLQPGFRSRLHSADAPLAIGAWAELEFVCLVTEHGFGVLWTDERDHSSRGRRSVDMVIHRDETRLHAEVTHCREEPLPHNVPQMFSFFGKERVPLGVYALTVGDGQPPIGKLRVALRRALATDVPTSLDVHIQGWRIQQLAVPAPVMSPTNVLALQQTRFAVLVDRIRRAVKKKRRQARDAGLRGALLAIVVLDRNASTFLEFAGKRQDVLAPLLYGSTSDPCELWRAVAVGAVPSDRFPPVPQWTLAVREGGGTQNRIEIDVPTMRIPSNEFRTNHTFEEPAESESSKGAVYYATVTHVFDGTASDQARHVTEIE